MAMIGVLSFLLWNFAKSCSVLRASPTRIISSFFELSTRSSTTAKDAPFSSASVANSFPLKFSPFNAKKIESFLIFLVSVDIPLLLVKVLYNSIISLIK
jgi:hypothetical protein